MNTSKLLIAGALAAAAMTSQAASWVNSDVYSFPEYNSGSTSAVTQTVAQNTVSPTDRFYLNKGDIQAAAGKSRAEVRQELVDANRTGSLNSIATYFLNGQGSTTQGDARFASK